MDSRPLICGAIDVGTVTCRLLVAQVNADGSLTELVRDHGICNLGEGVDATGRLSDQAIERTGQTVDRFVARVRDIEREQSMNIPVRAVATSASRDAENFDDLARRFAVAGIELSVISGEQEAALSFAGVTSSPDFADKNVVVIDAGGGSTELIAGVSAAKPAVAHSFNVGCRRMTDRFFHHDPPSASEIWQARAWLVGEMAPFIDQLRASDWFDGVLVAVAGTATSCVSMGCAMVDYDPTLVHGKVVSRAQVDDLLRYASSVSLQEREQIIGLEARRAPVIVGGLLILQTVMDLSGVRSFTVSEQDILQGIIQSLAH